MKDAVDTIIEQWKTEKIEQCLLPMETIGRLKRLNAIISKRLETVFNDFGLNNGEFDVLATLRRSGEPYTLTPTELFDSLMVTSGTMTNRLIQLEKRGLILRPKNETDKRSTYVQLSEEGKKLLEECLKAHMDNEAVITACLGEKKMEVLNSILKDFEAGL